MDDRPYEYDYVVIGSGFGGSVAALRLSEKGYRVAVLEMGRRWTAADFPKTNMNLRKFLWMPRLFLYGMQQFTLLRHVYVAHGCGVGGGSLVYANTLPVPPSHVFRDAHWPTGEDWEAKLRPFYELARYMLGAVEAEKIHPVDELLRDVVDGGMNKGGATFRRHTVSIYYGGGPGETAADPFFGGEGPERSGCIHCGECMSGCKHNAKNTLDKNYLYLAEKRGAEVHPETRVTDIRPLPEGGYAVDTEHSLAKGPNKPRRTFRARGVVVAASVLGTVKLLLDCKRRGSLPKLSDRLGHYVRTNAEAFGAVITPPGVIDHTACAAITSGVNLPDGTHVEAVRCGRGHNFIGWQTTLYAPGEEGRPRWLSWLLNGLRHPLLFVRSVWIADWARRTTLFMAMKPSDSHLNLVLKGGLFGRRLDSELAGGSPPEVYMPVFNDALRRLRKKLNGRLTGGIMETVLNISTTAHILGGATMGSDPSDGVCDAQGRVFGYDNLYICDGSVVPANLSVNPSLTITALSEYIMANIPPKPGAEERYIAIPEALARVYRPASADAAK